MPFVDTETREQIIADVLAARKQRAEFLQEMKVLQCQGVQAARNAATVLKGEYGATRVVLFGSMLDPEHMTRHSDIDLAVWGIKSDDYLRAGVAAEKGHQFSVDLIDAETTPPYIQAAIHQGMEL